MLKSLSTWLLLSSAFTTLGCSSAETFDNSTAEGAFRMAQKLEKDERFEEAVANYSDVKNKFPYSRYATDAELKIADIEFTRENYAEAETAYRIFKEFHPSVPNIDYVTLRLGLSVYNQLPPTIDRDLKLATNAIEHFDQLISSYPNSEYVKEARTFKKKAEQMLADKAHYIAEFYFIREKWESALGRYEDLMRSHPGRGYDSKSLYGATLSAYRMKEMDKAKTYFKRLLAEHPDSKELALARKELADGF
jgi:outer membrane protein assembly factor BamD